MSAGIARGNRRRRFRRIDAAESNDPRVEKVSADRALFQNVRQKIRGEPMIDELQQSAIDQSRDEGTIEIKDNRQIPGCRRNRNFFRVLKIGKENHVDSHAIGGVRGIEGGGDFTHGAIFGSAPCERAGKRCGRSRGEEPRRSSQFPPRLHLRDGLKRGRWKKNGVL